MIKILILIIIFFVALFVIVPTIILSVIRFLFTMMGGTSSRGTRMHRKNTYQSSNSNTNTTYTNAQEPAADGAKKKVFDKDEGEYVSFEEIKTPTDKQ
ncbi:MAG: DUF4834 family protein [Bacteroidaceae bacterium]|nr:DUF4834 family protein [Bacteroidaceae bacterium]